MSDTCEPLELPTCDCYKYAHQVCDVCQIWRPEIYRLTAQLAEAEQVLKEKTAECERLAKNNFVLMQSSSNDLYHMNELLTKLHEREAECEELRSVNAALKETYDTRIPPLIDKAYKAGMEKCVEIAEHTANCPSNNAEERDTANYIANAIRDEIKETHEREEDAR